MAAGNLLVLLDDIATVLDDVSLLTQMAAKKTAGVLGDDLALNAQQVAGVRAERELPVVWAVGRGSMVNKAILVPLAMTISAIVPGLIIPLLMVGGAYLCFEGVEKLAHRWRHGKNHEREEHAVLTAALATPEADLATLERDKIKGAIRTDFVLSAEIIVITLGTVKDQPLMTQAVVLAAIAVLMTVGVYGLVAAIVKLDDAGLALSRVAGRGLAARMARALGATLLRTAPWLMKFLAVAGTVAMFLVGGGIVAHHWPAIAHMTQPWIESAWAPLQNAIGLSVNLLIGVAIGVIVLGVVNVAQRLRARLRSTPPNKSRKSTRTLG